MALLFCSTISQNSPVIACEFITPPQQHMYKICYFILFFLNLHQYKFSQEFVTETWGAFHQNPASYSLDIFCGCLTRLVVFFIMGNVTYSLIWYILCARCTQMATNQQCSYFHARSFADEGLFTQRDLQKVTDPGFAHLEELFSSTVENVSGLTSHFQLVVFESSLESMLIRLFTPADVYVSIQKGQKKLTLHTHWAK